jgi:ribA/ribD-fused uncharacterized protein
MAITRFTKEHDFLSNFYPCRIKMSDGLTYPSVENAFQAQKTDVLEYRLPFVHYTAGQAKRNGRKLTMRKDWEIVKVQVMREALRDKFNHPDLWRRLQGTWPQELVEGNTWGDVYWGMVLTEQDPQAWSSYEFSFPPVLDWQGKNMLGKLLMSIRDHQEII